MRVLGFDTSTDLLAMAVTEDERLVGELAVRDPRGPTESLVPLIGRFLEQLGLSVREVDAFAVGTGPGSWTGTRVGVITAKVLAFATGKPAAGVPSFDAMVYGCGIREGVVWVLSAFGRDRVFHAAYELHGGDYRRVTGYGSGGLDEVLKEVSGRVVFIGQGALKHREALSAVGRSEVLPQHESPSGRSVALLGYRSLVSGASGDPEALSPIYVALAQAEAARQLRGV